MSNPVLVEVTRGPLVESRHRGAIAITDETGKLVYSIGDVERPVFPRSAIKVLQALPLVESGAAEALDFDAAELALACASHNGEAVHVNGARAMLRKAGLDEDALECGSHWPKRMDDIAALNRSGESPCALHNNCSGKHAGFLGLAKTMGVPVQGYIEAEHPVQREIKATLEALTGDLYGADVCGVDGCSIPTYAAPLASFSNAFSKLVTGRDLEPLRAQAATKLMEACMAEPLMVAGTKRFCTQIMEAFEGRVFVKTGAEGVFCAALPELGFGVALKCDDGGTRGAETMMAAVLDSLLDLTEHEAQALEPWLRPQLSNWNKRRMGEIRPVEDFSTLLEQGER